MQIELKSKQNDVIAFKTGGKTKNQCGNALFLRV